MKSMRDESLSIANFVAVAVAGPELARADAVGARFAPDDLLSHATMATKPGTATDSASR